MLDELQRRNYSQSTVRSYIFAAEDFTRYFHRSPERLGPEHIRQYQAYLFRERKLSPGTIQGRTAALRFLFVKTLRRPYLPDDIPFPKRQRRLPTILDQQEVARLIDSAGNLMHRTMMMMLYATGLRRAEMCHLKVSDIDSKRMVIHVRQGKGGREIGREPDASHHDDDAVCDGFTPSRDVPPQGLRYRQQAHGHSCAPGQGWPRPRRAADPEAAGDST